MKTDEILFLTSREIQSLLTLDECIGAVEHAFRLYGEGKAVPPAVLSMHTEDGGFHVKAGLLQLDRSYFAAKVNGNFPENGTRFGLPPIQGVIVLFDGEKGTPLALMDSREITSLRTAAATAVAAKYLARQDSRTVTVCGCGNQGRVQVKAISRVRPLQTVFAYDKDGERALRFAHELASALKISVTPVTDLAAAVRQSDICVTCTPSRQPLLGPDDVRPGTFLAAVGADNPQKQELHPTLMARSKIVCDILEQCAAMGDLHHALGQGIVTEADVHAELGEVVAGKKLGRESDEEIIVFDSTGMALQDVAAAALVYESAVRAECGISLNLAS
jgi:alanine dehydrogenase